MSADLEIVTTGIKIKNSGGSVKGFSGILFHLIF